MRQARGYERYLVSSVKGEAAIDWSNERARKALLAGIAADADRLLELAWQALLAGIAADADRLLELAWQAQGELRMDSMSIAQVKPLRPSHGATPPVPVSCRTMTQARV